MFDPHHETMHDDEMVGPRWQVWRDNDVYVRVRNDDPRCPGAKGLGAGVVFFIVLSSLLVQGMTLVPVTKWLGVIERSEAERLSRFSMMPKEGPIRGDGRAETPPESPPESPREI